MLTRAELARSIGKSIATVRRLEGVVLSPMITRNGTRLFDEHDVARLRAEPALVAKYGRSQWFETKKGSRPRRPAEARHTLGDGLEEFQVVALAEVLDALECASPHVLRRIGIDVQLLSRFAAAVSEVEFCCLADESPE